MTEEQKCWFDDHPGWPPVRNYPAVSLKGWTDQGYLFENGKFSLDDGKTLFWYPKAMRVGREYEIV